MSKSLVSYDPPSLTLRHRSVFQSSNGNTIHCNDKLKHNVTLQTALKVPEGEEPIVRKLALFYLNLMYVNDPLQLSGFSIQVDPYLHRALLAASRDVASN